MGRKKKFIEKKKSVTFQLLARDSSDPNYNETPGGDRVFIRVDNNPYSVDTFFEEDNSANGRYDDDPNSISADADEDAAYGGENAQLKGYVEGASTEESGALPEHVRREILELGFPDDGYNYLLHMREIKNTGGGSYYYSNPKANFIQLPYDVKAYDASRVLVQEVKIDDTNDKSIYSVASKTVGVRVQKVLDPEVAALLDDSDLTRFGSDDDDLEEDFVVLANFPDEGKDLGMDKKLNLIGESSAAVDNGSVEKEAEAQNGFANEKPRVRSMLDEQFDLLESQEYGTDNEDDDAYNGYIAEEDESLANKLNHVLGDHAMDDFEVGDKYVAPADLLHNVERTKGEESLDSAADVIHRCIAYAEKYENEDEKDVVVVEESSDESEQWDCETIVTTYSNLDNHPAKIEVPGAARKKKIAETISGALNTSSHVIPLRGKEKLPVDFLPRVKKSDMEKVKVFSSKTEQVKRKQHGQESKEEKKERKAAVKEERREARRVKKEMKGLYRGEAQLAQRVAAVAGPSSIRLL